MSSDWNVWAVHDWTYDSGERILALYPTEVEALRYTVDLGYPAKISPMQPGCVADQLKDGQP